MFINRVWGYFVSLKDRLPLVYSLLLITLIPLTLVINTWWNLSAFERDMNFAVRDQALAVQQTFIAVMAEHQMTADEFKQFIARLQTAQPSIIHASVLNHDANDSFKLIFTSDTQRSIQDETVFLNQLAWSQNESYFSKTYDPLTHKTLWMVITPYKDAQGTKIGLVNFKVSTEAIDTVLNRTTRDALIILVISVFGIVLLLINHLRFFEKSLLVDRLQQIDKMKDDFISVASHELRTPLTAIKSCISMIKEDFKEKIPQDLKEWFDIMDISVARLNDLVSDLLNVSRLEQNRMDFELNPVDTTALIKEITSQLQFSALEKKLALHFDETHSFQVLANQDRLREVLVNLIGNAIKYTLSGSVTVKQVEEGNTLRILVQDTGIGIAPEDKEKLFQKFSRITTDQTREIPGTGLGLWITKAMVERMDGKIYVDSIVGQGTVFTVVLKQAKA